MHCGFQRSALYHCRVHLSCHFESFISECTSASVTRTVDLPFKNGHSTHSLSLCSYFKLYFSARLYFTYPSLRILHAYIWTDAAKQIPRQNVICGPSRLHVRMEIRQFYAYSIVLYTLFHSSSPSLAPSAYFWNVWLWECIKTSCSWVVRAWGRGWRMESACVRLPLRAHDWCLKHRPKNVYSVICTDCPTEKDKRDRPSDLSIYLSIHPSVRPSVHPSIHPLTLLEFSPAL